MAASIAALTYHFHGIAGYMDEEKVRIWEIGYLLSKQFEHLKCQDNKCVGADAQKKAYLLLSLCLLLCFLFFRYDIFFCDISSQKQKQD